MDEEALLLVLVFLIVLEILLFGYTYDLFVEEEQHKDFLSSENSRLKSSLNSCVDELKKYSPKCYTTMDCSRNPDLEGCSIKNCNTCCGNICNLMACIDWNKYALEVIDESG